jgi:ectoine hydroxylase-related dioxygenase (phytanoyl-CoA dioxygenase family)
LVDLTPKNGAIQVLPGSHRLYPTYRGSTIKGIYEEVSEQIKPYLQTLYLKAGEAVFFDQSIIHYSDANLSDDVRIVTNTYFTHKDATFRIAYWKEEFGKKVELFEENDSFMTDFEQFGHNIHNRPEVGTSLGLIDYDFPQISEQQLNRLYGKKQEAAKPLYKRVLEGLFN